MKQNSFFVAYSSCKIILLTFLFLLFPNSNLNAQTTIINPTTVGGFESGTTFAANGWTTVGGTATQNVWFVGTNAAGFTGARCAYISNTAGGAYSYTNSAARASFMYRNVSVPAGEGDITLSFKWKGDGESSFDKMRVWVVPTSFTPTSGTAITASGSAPTGNVQVGATNYSVQTAWTTTSFKLPSAYAGTTVRLVFEWTNDGSLGTPPPTAIDDISLTSAIITSYCAPTTSSSSYWVSNFNTTGGFVNINNTTTYSAGGYGDFSSQFVNESAGGSFNFSVTMSSSTHGINIWVDWNKDFDFADAGEKVYASGAYVGNATGTITVPGPTANGTYRMRVATNFSATDPLECGNTTYTETEDYSILVSPAPTCYPPTVSASATSTTSGSASWTASASGTTPIGYEYVISTSNTPPGGSGTPTALTSTTFTGLLANTTYYVFVRSNCGAGDYSAWGSSSFFTGFCSSTGSSSSYYIDDFSTTSGTANITNNNTGYTATGYANYTAMNVSQYAGGSVAFNVGFASSTYGVAIFIDWNNDLDFNDVGETVYESNAYVSPATGIISIPPGATIGAHRMRVIANAFTSNPTACGATSSSETEDYTFTVLTHPTCAGNPSVISSYLVSSTSATISWNAGSPAPANGYQYWVTTTTNVPAAATAPTGSVGAGVTSVTLTGLTTGTRYYVWVRSNCGGSQGVWVGMATFICPSCSLGPGTGTTVLGCPNVVAGGLGLSGADPAPITCISGSCVNLEATYLPLGATTNYTVSSIAYSPPYQYGCMRNPVSVNVDDVWSPVINLPFNFCFYGNVYNQCVIGSNGVISFDVTKANTSSGYSFSNNLPSTTGSLFPNAIYGVYHDINPAITGGEVGYELITLNTGCRALVVSYNNVAMFSDNTLKYTGMMVLYENTNIIDVYIQQKVVDGTWNGGNAIVGIQDSTGTAAVVAPGRNGLSADWTATNEAWRFTPSGAATTSIKWYQGAGTSGAVVGTTANISVCPTATTVYTAEVTYSLCGGSSFAITDQVTATVTVDKTWNGSISTAWNTAGNWTPSGVPTASHAVTIPNTVTKPIVSTTNAVACSVTVQNGGVLTVNTGSAITVTNQVNVNAGGQFIVQDDASLVQVNNVTNTGNIEYRRVADLRLSDYCYWSSPVGNGTTGTFPVQNVSPLTPAGNIFRWGTTTVNPNGGQGNWINTAENMIPTRGYIVRGPSNFNNVTASPLTATFIGTPNNGNFSTTVFRGTNFTTPGTQGIPRTANDDNWNLVGNPYPSALGVNEFLQQNSVTSPVISGFVYIWRHLQLPTNPIDPFYQNFGLNYFAADYMAINRTAATSGPGDYKIGGGQGFMVMMNPGAAGSGTITFNNSMRSATFANNQFYKGQIQTKESDKNAKSARVWLDLFTPNNSVTRTVIGYVEDATNEKDVMFDAITNTKSADKFYSLIEDEPQIIQGRKLPFNSFDKVPLGFKLSTAGEAKIAIAFTDGMFADKKYPIYLEDKKLNKIHNLLDGPYAFTDQTGVNDSRFVLRYTDKSVENGNIENQVNIFVSEGINVMSYIYNIKNIEVYDVLGKNIYKVNDVNNTETILSNIRPTSDVLLVKVTLDNNQTVVKKVIY